MTHLKSPHTNITADESKRLVDCLILNSSFTPDLGLFHGKMGIVLFFALYARRYNNPILDDFAGELLEEIYEDIHAEIPINLESGLCGIGWGIEYLVQHGLMEGDTDDILGDIDRRIMERDPSRITDLSFRTGLAGILFYATARLAASRHEGAIPFDAVYLSDLKEAALHADFSSEKEIPASLLGDFIDAVDGIRKPKPQLPLLFQSTLPAPLPDDLSTVSLGLENGILLLIEN